MQLTNKQIELIKAEALIKYPEEMCGVLLEDTFIQLSNQHDDKLHNFKILAEDLIPYLGSIKAIVHSHTLKREKPDTQDPRTPSYEDVKAQQQTGVPFLIVATDGFNVTEPLEFPKPLGGTLIGRPFIWFIHDCYSLVQDYYYNEFGIVLPPHKAEVNFKDIRKCNNLFDTYLKDYGFKEVASLEDIKNGDLLLLDGVQSGKRNHLGIYHNGKVLHQASMSIEVPLETFIGKIHCRLVYEG